jgi:DNA-binding transcriptional LysR family regulator
MLMELRQLEYLVAVAEEAGFTRAAERLHVAQPGISAQIRRLEREFGEELLDRTGRTVRLTEAGATVLPYARAALAAVAGARLAVHELAGLVRGRVAIGVVTACGGLDVAGLLAAFHGAHPGVEISLAEDNSDHLLAAVHTGELDLAVVGLAGPPPDGVRTHVILDEELLAAVALDDPLAGVSEITIAELCERALISLPVGTGMRACLDEACAAGGARPRIAFEAGDPGVLAQLAARGLGVAILPASAVAARPGRLHGIAVRPGLRSRVELAWRADGPTSPAARAMVTHARAVLGAD